MGILFIGCHKRAPIQPELSYSSHPSEAEQRSTICIIDLQNSNGAKKGGAVEYGDGMRRPWEMGMVVNGVE